MKNPYETLMDEIHVPAELNDRVLRAARRETPAPRRKHPWCRAAVCAACALAIVVGGITFAPPDSSSKNTPASSTPLPRWEFSLTACAADAVPGSDPVDLSFAVEQSGAAQGCCLFQIESESAVSLRLSIQHGELYVVQENGSIAPLGQKDDNSPLDLSPKERFGFRLTDPVGFLCVEVSFPDGSTSRKTYGLFAESSAEAPEKSSLDAPLFYRDARPVSKRVRAVDPAEHRQLLWPLDASEKKISASFGLAGPVSSFFHTGIDLPAATGTAILAAADGIVVERGMDQADGLYLILDHGNGLTTCYHCCSALTTELDDQVKAGDKIAEVGNTGRSTGPHLHFEVRDNGQFQDPQLYFSWETIDQLRK